MSQNPYFSIHGLLSNILRCSEVIALISFLSCNATDSGSFSDNSPFDGLDCIGDCGAGASAYGTSIGSYRGVPAYSNGNTHGCHDCSNSSDSAQAKAIGLTCGSRCQDTVLSSPQTPYGLAYQCVEYVRRFYATIYNDIQFGNSHGNAKDYYVKNKLTGTMTLPEMGFNCWVNDTDVIPPQPDDILVWTNGVSGHIGIVRYADNRSIQVIQQNNSNSQTDSSCIVSMDNTSGNVVLESTACGIRNSSLVWCRRPGNDWKKCGSATLCPDGFSCFVDTCKPSSCSMSSCFQNVDYYPYVYSDASGGGTVDVAVADVDRDMHLDILTANRDGTVSVILGNGNGTFVAPKIIPVLAGNYTTIRITTGDFNVDGLIDIVTVNSSDSSINVLMGVGGGAFGVPRAYPVGTSPWFVAIGDLNIDAKPDLVVANRDSNSISVLLNNGDGTFKSQQIFLTGNKPVSIAIGDLNGDMKPDAIVTNLYDANVIILLGNGDGSLRAQNLYSVGINPNHVSIADFNKDNKLDAIVSNSSSDTMSLLIGNGDGSFKPQAALNPGIRVDWGIAIDLNLDNKQDIVFAGSANAGFMLGNGDGTFQASKGFPIPGVSGLAVGKLNGDMVPDIITGTYLPRVAVLLSK